MRSIAFTFLLAAGAALVSGGIGWQMREGNLDALFGVPPVQPGHRLYTNFQTSEVGRIRIEAHGVRADFVKDGDSWKSTAPPGDRMHPPYAGAIIEFTRNLIVTDYAESGDIDRTDAGLREGTVQIELETPSGDSLACYRLGNQTPLVTENEALGKLDPNVYIQPRERGRKDYVYACVGDINPLFIDGLKHLRDHRPFYFNPLNARKIRLRGPEGELTIGREMPSDPWRIVKPLDLRTNREMMVFLLEGLVELKATNVSDRSAVTLPSLESGGRSQQIGLTVFGREEEVLLEIYPPESQDATEVLATVSDRPDTVFHLPVKAGAGSLANLPFTVNEIRDRALTHLNIADLGAISIRAVTGPPILITSEPPKPWQVKIDGRIQEANEQRLFALLKALGTQATGFESDAATDLKPWGLDRPFLIIELLDRNHQGLRLNFGMDTHGGVFVNRQGTPTVMSVDPSILHSISIQPHEWRHARLWSVSAVDLKGIERTIRDHPTLKLDYDFNSETWKGTFDDADITDRIDPSKANQMLNALVGVNVARWLAIGDEAATAALAEPVFTLTVSEKTIDDFGDETGEIRRTLKLAPIPGSSDFYGIMSTEPHPFIMERDVAQKIGVDPLEK